MMYTSDPFPANEPLGPKPRPADPLTPELRDTLVRLAICSKGLVDLSSTLDEAVSHLKRFTERSPLLDQCSASVIAASNRLSSYLDELAGEVSHYANFYEDLMTAHQPPCMPGMGTLCNNSALDA